MDLSSLLKSKNPLYIALGLMASLFTLAWGGMEVMAKVQDFTTRYETVEAHDLDVRQKEESFKKDVRIAILENNAVLLEALDKRLRR